VTDPVEAPLNPRAYARRRDENRCVSDTRGRTYSWAIAGGRTLELGRRTLVMGILNVTPDSFSTHMDRSAAVETAFGMIEDGVDILDVGGESTRPDAAPVPLEEELRRVIPVIKDIVHRAGGSAAAVPISIDTYKAEVARAAIDAGATIVNDVSGLQYEPALAEVVAERGAGLVLMHTRGRSSAMYEHANYSDVIAEVARELQQSIDRALAAGVSRESIVVDAGIGFAKRPEQSYAVLTAANHPAFLALDRPVLSGPSRKSFLRAALGDVPPEERVWGTAAAVTAAVLTGSHIVRVHDVKEMVQAVRVADKIRSLQWIPSSP
jgi:dihydropteroate synthase